MKSNRIGDVWFCWGCPESCRFSVPRPPGKAASCLFSQGSTCFYPFLQSQKSPCVLWVGTQDYDKEWFQTDSKLNCKPRYIHTIRRHIYNTLFPKTSKYNDILSRSLRLSVLLLRHSKHFSVKSWELDGVILRISFSHLAAGWCFFSCSCKKSLIFAKLNGQCIFLTCHR